MDLYRWEGTRYMDLYRWEGTRYVDLYRWEGTRYVDLYRWEGTRYVDLYRWERTGYVDLYTSEGGGKEQQGCRKDGRGPGQIQGGGRGQGMWTYTHLRGVGGNRACTQGLFVLFAIGAQL